MNNSKKRAFDDSLAGLSVEEELKGMRNTSNKPRVPYQPTPDGHGIAALTSHRMNAVSKTVVSLEGPPPCLSNTTVVSNVNAINMTMDISEHQMRMLVRDCVKKNCFAVSNFTRRNSMVIMISERNPCVLW